MKTTILLLFSGFISNNILCQVITFKPTVYVPICRQYLLSINIKDSTIVSDVSSAESKFFKIYDYDSINHKFKFTFFDSAQKTYTIGYYVIDNKNIYTGATGTISASGKAKRRIIYFKYYKAIIAGDWIYTDEKGNPLKNLIKIRS
jgi:hypothetical protein